MRKYVFASCFLLFLITPFLFTIVFVLFPQISLTPINQEAKYLSGGQTDTSVQDNLSIDAILSKKFQDSVEGAIDENIPARGKVLLVNSKLQNCAISTSNVFFGWSAFPTHYGSQYLFLPGEEALIEMPMLDESRIVSPDDVLGKARESGELIARQDSLEVSLQTVFHRCG